MAVLTPREQYLSAVQRHSGLPSLIILKIDVQRRGVQYTDNALQHVDKRVHQLLGTNIFGSRDGKLLPVPESLILRDGTSVVTSPTTDEFHPYWVDYVDGAFVLTDDGEIVETVELWTKPKFYDLKTKRGIPMEYVFSARPQRLSISPYRYCHFWDNDKGCLYCDIVNNLRQDKRQLGVPTKLDIEDISDAFAAALQEQGRFAGICLTAGSNTGGAEPFDAEVDYYIEVLQAIGRHLNRKKFPSQMVATAFSEKQLRRLYENTGIVGYTSDIEVLNKELFDWICPGKSEWIGYEEWKRRLIQAVGIFGRGNVNTGIVGGVELAKPYGFKDEKEGLASTLEEAEKLAEQGVSVIFTVWVPRPGSKFADQKNASLEYYVGLADGLQKLRIKYGLSIDHDDYRRCGNHPDTDLARLALL